MESDCGLQLDIDIDIHIDMHLMVPSIHTADNQINCSFRDDRIRLERLHSG